MSLKIKKKLRNIYFITGNDYKFQIATEAFKGSGFKLIQKNLNTPEIQSDDLGEIASYSARWAADALKHPVFLTDVGCFIEALNGFPGPFIKYINKYFTAGDFLKLMAGKSNRKVFINNCLAFCEPGKEPVLFYSSAEGRISTKPGKHGDTSINKIFIPNGFNRPESEIPRKDMIKFWNSYSNVHTLLIELLDNK